MNAVAASIELGLLLLSARDRGDIRHGGLTDWLDQHASGISDRHARRAMQIAAHVLANPAQRPALEAMSLRQALALTAPNSDTLVCPDTPLLKADTAVCPERVRNSGADSARVADLERLERLERRIAILESSIEGAVERVSLMVEHLEPAPQAHPGFNVEQADRAIDLFLNPTH